MPKKDARFEVVFETKSLAELTQVLRDSETGVCYLFHQSGVAGGLTPLLGSDGTPVVTP